MKKLVIFAIFVATGAFANNGAVRIDDFGCGVLDGNGNGVYTTDSKVVMTPSPNGNTVLKCFAKNVPNNTGRAVRWNYENTGYSCGTQSGSTTDWHETVSTSGRAVLTCIIH